MNAQYYDLFADIHGHADELDVLLEALGYEAQSQARRHPGGRKIIFLGDYIDRGPKIRDTLVRVRSMVESGHAIAILGNHEFNALAYNTSDGVGGWVREH